MLIDLHTLNRKYALYGGKVNGVLHVGAHTGEEGVVYDELGYRPVYWVEADEDTIPKLWDEVHEFEGHEIINAVVADQVGKTVTFNVANNEQSSSILELGTHETEHPEVHYTGSRELEATTIDQLLADDMITQTNFLNLDIQGAELLALKGAKQFLKGVDFIYSEVNVKELYKGGALLPPLDGFLDRRGCDRRETEMTPHGWGYGFWCRRK